VSDKYYLFHEFQEGCPGLDISKFSFFRGILKIIVILSDFAYSPMELDIVKLKDIKPALSGYLREAHTMLKLSSVPDERVVHDVRVLMKKSRAVLKLIKSQVDPEAYERDYYSFREVGRIMCSWRETSVHRKTLKELKKGYSKIFSLVQLEKLDALLRKPETSVEPTACLKNDLENIDELLNKAGYRLRFQSMGNLDPKILISELDNTYNNVVEKYLVCRNNPKPVNIHQFRKRAKDFLYQLWFFRPLNPSMVKTLEKRLDAMTQNLGKFNDLAQLVETLGYKYSASANLPALDELIVVIREEQDRYLLKVWPTAYKVFCPGQKLVNMLGFRILII
jgi:CHAD domain-containing protein